MMKKIINWMNHQSIRTKVLVFAILMSTIPLLLMSFFFLSNAKSDLEERILKNHELLLKILTVEIELEFNQTFQKVQRLTAINDQENTLVLIYELLKQNESIEEVILTDENGVVEQKVSRYSLNIPDSNVSWLTEEIIRSSQLENRKFGNVEYNQLGQPVLNLAVTFSENGKKKAIGVTIQLQKIIGKISSLSLGNSSYLYLSDRTGKIFAHQDHSKLWQKETGIENREVLSVKEELTDLGWSIVLVQPKSTVYEPINEMFRKGSIVVMIVLLIGSIISIYGGLYFTGPIVLLDRAMKNLKAGKSISPIQLKRKDELGKLFYSFNEMSAELQEKSLRLEQEKERLNVVVSSIGAGLALVTENYRVTWMNPQLKDWTGRNGNDFLCYKVFGGHKTPCQDCLITCPDVFDHADTIMRMRNDTNEDRFYRHRMFPLNHVLQGEGEYLVMIEDITEQKLMDEKIIQTDKLSALGLMASSFAHEVNNPLTTINVYAEDLIDRIKQADEDLDEIEMTYYLSKIKENIDRCKQITSNVLNFSRKSNWNLSQTNIRETIDNSISLLEHSIRRRGIELNVSIQDHLPIIVGDQLKLMQVLINVINNAIDAVEDTGKVEIKASQDQDHVIVQIRDNGSGISEKSMQHIFDPFYTTKPVGKGTGLGLSVCYGIIEEFHGNIQIKSKEGMGTTVNIKIPFLKKIEEDMQ